jgi:hypothetical protein
MKNFPTAASIPLSHSRARSPNNSSGSASLIAMLEARIANLEQAIGLDSSGDINIEGDKITIHGSKVTIRSSGKLELKGDSDVVVKGMGVEIRSASNLQIKSTTLSMTAPSLDLSTTNGSFTSSSSLELVASGVASIVGATTKIGKGTLPVATASTSISAAGFTLSSTIVSPNVLA